MHYDCLPLKAIGTFLPIIPDMRLSYNRRVCTLHNTTSPSLQTTTSASYNSAYKNNKKRKTGRLFRLFYYGQNMLKRQEIVPYRRIQKKTETKIHNQFIVKRNRIYGRKKHYKGLGTASVPIFSDGSFSSPFGAFPGSNLLYHKF